MNIRKPKPFQQNVKETSQYNPRALKTFHHYQSNSTKNSQNSTNFLQKQNLVNNKITQPNQNQTQIPFLIKSISSKFKQKSSQKPPNFIPPQYTLYPGKIQYYTNKITNLNLSPTRKQEESLQLRIAMSLGQKQKFIRDISLQVQMFEAKSKQPNILMECLDPLKEQIYNKFDEYYINNLGHLPMKIISHHHGNQNRDQNAALLPSNKKNKYSSVFQLKVESKVSQNSSRKSPITIQQRKTLSQNSIHEKQKDNNLLAIKSIQNLSSLSQNLSIINDQERPFVETELQECQFQALNASAQRKMSDLNDHHESYIELKDNIRILEERIIFLIHRLEDNKKVINKCKEEKISLQQQIENLDIDNKSIKQQKNILKLNYNLIQKQFQIKTNQFSKLLLQYNSLSKLFKRYSLELVQYANKVEYLTRKIEAQEKQISSLEDVITNNKIQHLEISQSLKNTERLLENKYREFDMEMQKSEIEKQELKMKIKEYKSRLQIEGINFKFQQASKLQRYIEQNENFHQQQINKIKRSYEQIIRQKQFQNQPSTHTFPQVQMLKTHSAKESTGPCLNMEAQKLYQLQEQNKKLQDLIELLKEYYQSKEQEVQALRDELQKQKQICQLKIYENKELINLNIRLKEYYEQILQTQKKHKKNVENHCHIDSKIIQFVYPKILQCYLQDESTLESLINNSNTLDLRVKLTITVKLIEFALSLLSYKKKLSSLNPLLILVKNKNKSNLNQIQFFKKQSSSEVQNQMNLFYCAPEVLLGFSQTNNSYCWTIGIILDRMIHGKYFFRKIDQIIIRKDNYVINKQQYRELTFLGSMLKKNQKQRISLEQTKRLICNYLKNMND